MSAPRTPPAPRSILVLHGPSLGELGRREPEVYGETTLAEIDQTLVDLAGELGAGVRSLQSNHEGVLVDAILDAPRQGVDGILLNPAAYTHTSVALGDALRAAALPAVEVHLSHLHRREAFRRRSYTAPACIGVISGFGPGSYTLGLRALIDYLRRPRPRSGV